VRSLPWVGWIAWLAARLPVAQAHRIAAQRGMLNLVRDGAFVVLWMPVSAFSGIDDDGDGKLGAAELKAHQTGIEDMVRGQVRLSVRDAALPLQGLMLSLSPPDQDSAAPADQPVVTGRYRLPAAADAARVLRFMLPLYGRTADEQRMAITVTRGAEHQEVLLTPAQTLALWLPRRPSDATSVAGRALGGAACLLSVGSGAAWSIRRRTRR